jgi:predicted nucleic acid-binding protein
MPDTNIVIADTSSLILFHKIGEFELLRKLYNKVIITPEVQAEFQEQLPNWIKIESVLDKKYQEFIETQVDWGEASTIALAKEIENTLLLLDDLKARKLAGKLNLKFTGTLGVINKARQLGIVHKIKPLIDKLLLTDFRISENIVNELLRLNNELGD